jgi:hypothetical protein
MFSEPFDIGHAGSALDQPTIGKWLFWFTVMAASSLPYAALVGWLANRRSKLGRLMFSAAIAILCFLLLCILSWPLLWLVQYVWSMGPTPRRAVGLFYAIQSGWLVIIFLAWAVRNPGTQSASAVGSSAPGRFRPRVREAKAVASLRSAPALQDGARNLGSIGIQHD